MRLVRIISLLLLLATVTIDADESGEVVSLQAESDVSSIPFKEHPTAPEGTYGRVATVSLLVLLIILIVALILRKQLVKRGLMSETTSARIVVCASRRLTPKLSVFVIDVDDQSYLLAHNGNNIQLLRHEKQSQRDVANDV